MVDAAAGLRSSNPCNASLAGRFQHLDMTVHEDECWRCRTVSRGRSDRWRSQCCVRQPLFFLELLTKQGPEPRHLVTNKLRSCSAAHRIAVRGPHYPAVREQVNSGLASTDAHLEQQMLWCKFGRTYRDSYLFMDSCPNGSALVLTCSNKLTTGSCEPARSVSAKRRGVLAEPRTMLAIAGQSWAT